MKNVLFTIVCVFLLCSSCLTWNDVTTVIPIHETDIDYRDLNDKEPGYQEYRIWRKDSTPEKQRESIYHRECPVNATACVSICCEPGLYLKGSGCFADEGSPLKEFKPLPIYKHNLQPSTMSFGNFVHVYGNPCSSGSYALNENEPAYDVFYLLENGMIYTRENASAFEEYSEILDIGNYCITSVPKGNGSETVVSVCFPSVEKIPIMYPIAMLLSVPFLLLTFVVYSIVPEMNNLHGLTLRAYISMLMVAYIALSTVQLGGDEIVDRSDVCITLAFIIHFSFLASFFWLNVMCFDIWWTFGGFRSLQGSVKQRERKKFIMYSIYAWGSASILTGICIIMDFVPSVPRNFIRPEFGVESCWFTTDKAKAIYFYGPMGVTVLCNICLFISTALKIVQHKKDTAHHLKSSESRRHDDNKQWFNLYLKLFVVMGINWSMEIISWLCRSAPEYVWYITDLANTLQGLIIFIIFVWKDKIKRLLLKRFGFQDRSFLSRNSTRSAYHSSASRTCTTSFPLQEKTNPFAEPTCRNKPTIEENDGN